MQGALHIQAKSRKPFRCSATDEMHWSRLVVVLPHGHVPACLGCGEFSGTLMRVLLSYASEDEHEESLEQTEGDGHPGATVGVTPNKMNVPSCDDDVQRIVEHDVMGLVPDLEEETEGSERVDERPNDSGLFSRATAKDSTTGQWPALGSRMRQWNEEQDEEEDAEYDSTEDAAMAYLRAVK
ncbi:hypothetical protein B0A54_14312 [Friedmanniomyces endolithicus]|uniref:Uncharacterized protein n=1 Tax=Friedmanniomyces endolithicus TaxID=329885 RepID=A0A4U0U806_9PEZI|nr:hypothetical protein B0A54_14312 [Friedmanniomyces endolithicus]